MGAEITHSLDGLYVLLHLALGWFSGLIPRNQIVSLWKQMMKSPSLQNKPTHVVSEGASGFKSSLCELYLATRKFNFSQPATDSCQLPVVRCKPVLQEQLTEEG